MKIKFITSHRNRRGQYASIKKTRITILSLFTLIMGISGYAHYLGTPVELISPLPESGESVRFISPEKVQASTDSAEPVKESEMTQKQEIMHYIVDTFGDDANLAITMLTKCENHSLNPQATNHNSNGTVDRGIFQVNSVHGGDEMYDWKTNIDTAYEIYHDQGNTFRAWTCAPEVGQENYLGQL